MAPGLRIGFFTECYHPIVNGVVGSIDALRDGLVREGNEVIVVAPEAPGFVDRDSSIVRIPSLPLPTPTAYRLVIPFVTRSDRERIARNLAIVHTHSPFVTGWMGLRYARRSGVPLVFTYHTRLEKYAHYVPFERTMTEHAALGLTRAYAHAADAVIVPTQAMERRLRELGVRTSIAVVPSAVDVERFAAGRRRADVRARLGAAEDERLVLFVSRLAREKNVELALRAFAQVGSAARLVVVGGGPHRAELESEARRLGVASRTTFTGEMAPDACPTCTPRPMRSSSPAPRRPRGSCSPRPWRRGCRWWRSTRRRRATCWGERARCAVPSRRRSPRPWSELWNAAAISVPHIWHSRGLG